jgi:hypothetical protein
MDNFTTSCVTFIISIYTLPYHGWHLPGHGDFDHAIWYMYHVQGNIFHVHIYSHHVKGDICLEDVYHVRGYLYHVLVDIYYVHGYVYHAMSLVACPWMHLSCPVGDIYYVHTWFWHVMRDIYHEQCMYIENCTMYGNTFTMFIDTSNMYEAR